MKTYVARAMEIVADETDVSDPELVRFYTLLVLVLGHRVTLADIHDAWGLWKVATRPDHWSLVPFFELAPEKQAKDEPYRKALLRAAARLDEEGGL